jgi:deaminated glutathione amidase
MWMSFGGIHEKVIDDAGNATGKIHNTHVIINSDGEIAGLYRKLHLFDVDTPEFKFRESKIVEAGKGLTEPIETPIGKIGLQICYDIRFPEAPIWLKKRGAEIITYPSAFAMTTGEAHWEVLNRSRAIENQCFIISAAQKGKHNQKRSSFGRAMAVSPWGKVLTKCKEELEVQFTEIDLSNISKIEGNMPCFSHRRSDVYEIEVMKTANQLTPPPREPFMFEKHPIDRKTIFHETEYCVAFTNIRCVVPGHVLVCTKRNIARVEDMTVAESKDLFATACRIAKVLDNHYDAKSTTLTVQDGEFAGQTVKHVHCHVMPRKKGDFENNDEIYVKLNEHDHNPVNPRRPIQEMIDEAQLYKKLLEK